MDTAYVTVDIGVLLRLHTALRVCRIVAVFLLLGPVVFGELQAAVWSTAGLGIVLGVANVSVRRLPRALLAGELACGCVLCILVIWTAAGALDTRGAFTPEMLGKLMFPVGVTAWLANRLRRFMYPPTAATEFEHVTELLHGHTERKTAPPLEGRARALLDVLLLIVLFMLFTVMQPLYVIAVVCFIMAYVLIRIAAPALGLLHSTDGALLVLGLHGPRGRVRRSHSWYLVTKGGNRLGAFGLFGVSIGTFTVFWFTPGIAGYLGSPAFSIVGPMLLLVAYACYRSGIEALARGLTDAEAARVEASGDFCLYLRSFADDVIELDFARRGWRRLVAVPFSFLPGAAPFRSIRFEEFLSRAMWRYRPLLAVAPGIDATVVGALQVRLAESGWQDRVVQLARRASSILIVAGNSPGLRWEAEQLSADAKTRGKLLLLFPPVSDEYLPARWNASLGISVQDAFNARTVAARLLADGRVQLIVAEFPSPSAYRMALRVGSQPAPNTASDAQVSE